ncbi:thioredoxin-dependent thiol peroxidase [Candidatus Woesearchaeota archaeon]|nr:thioredoxin-dependent thiol peroxidase [Candidatus Woesearchaeota archaeon]
MLTTGDSAPDFALKDRHGNVVSLHGLKADFVVVYFYPKDDTPGCTVEAKNYSASLDQFKRMKAEVIGISGGTEESKQMFCDKYQLKVTLLSDPDFSVSKAYGAYSEKSFTGKTSFGIKRMTFVLNKQRKVIHVYSSVNPETNHQEVLDFLHEVKP